MADEKNINSEEEDTIIEFTDENGETIELELIDMISYEGKNYVALVEPDGEEVFFYEAVPVEGSEDEENYYEVTDDALADILFDILSKNIADVFDFE